MLRVLQLTMMVLTAVPCGQPPAHLLDLVFFLLGEGVTVLFTSHSSNNQLCLLKCLF